MIILQILLKLRRLPHPSPPTNARPQRPPLLPTERRDDGDGVRAGGDDGRRGVEAHAADGDERRVGGHEAAPGRDAVEAARREGDALGRRAEDGPERDVRRRERGGDGELGEAVRRDAEAEARGREPRGVGGRERREVLLAEVAAEAAGAARGRLPVVVDPEARVRSGQSLVRGGGDLGLDGRGRGVLDAELDVDDAGVPERRAPRGRRGEGVERHGRAVEARKGL